MTTHIRRRLEPSANAEVLQMMAARLRRRIPKSVDVRKLALEASQDYCNRHSLPIVDEISVSLECRIGDLFEAMDLNSYRLWKAQYNKVADALDGLSNALYK